MLFNIDTTCDLFFVDITSDIADYADDTTPYICDKHFYNLISNLKFTVNKILCWSEYNLRANASKCHFFLPPFQHTMININRSFIKSSNREKLLGITIDSDFTFTEHINKLCQKACQKMHAFRIACMHASRISQYFITTQKSGFYSKLHSLTTVH